MDASLYLVSSVSKLHDDVWFLLCVFSSIDYKWVCSLVVYSCSEAKRVTAVLILNHCKTLLRGSNERAVVKVIQDPPTSSPPTLNILLPIITIVQGFVAMTWSSYFWKRDFCNNLRRTVLLPMVMLFIALLGIFLIWFKIPYASYINNCHWASQKFIFIIFFSSQINFVDLIDLLISKQFDDNDDVEGILKYLDKRKRINNRCFEDMWFSIDWDIAVYASDVARFCIDIPTWLFRKIFFNQYWNINN